MKDLKAVGASLQTIQSAEETLIGRAASAGITLDSIFFYPRDGIGDGVEITMRAKDRCFMSGASGQPSTQGLAFSLKQFDENIAKAAAYLATKKKRR